MGGDYFDYIPSRDDKVMLVIGDVCGHGIGLALSMAATCAYLRGARRLLVRMSLKFWRSQIAYWQRMSQKNIS